MSLRIRVSVPAPGTANSSRSTAPDQDDAQSVENPSFPAVLTAAAQMDRHAGPRKLGNKGERNGHAVEEHAGAVSVQHVLTRPASTASDDSSTENVKSAQG